MNLFNYACDLDPAAGRNEPIRPVLDGSFITTPLDSTAAFPSVSKPVLVTSVSHEAGFAIYSSFPDPLPEGAFQPICEATFGAERTAVVVNSPNYAPIPSLVDGSIDARTQLQIVGTDYLWKCSGWTFARAWTQNGGTAYVGQFVVGATYPGNEAVSYCTQPGVVCHQDDIQIVVGIFHLPLCLVPNSKLFISCLVWHCGKPNQCSIGSHYRNPEAVQGVPCQRQPERCWGTNLDPSHHHKRLSDSPGRVWRGHRRSMCTELLGFKCRIRLPIL